MKKEGLEFRKIITCSSQKAVWEELLKGSTTEPVAVVLRVDPKTYEFGNLGFLRSLAAKLILKSTIPVFIIPR
ncbi:MAG: hypothetical protein OK457_03300 [Thaumarchaeota archaeon]|nr:hypothetical protein [Nitrososphaerota archaeon]